MTDAKPQAIHNFRCPVCTHLLFRGQVLMVEIKCDKCKSLMVFHASGKAQLIERRRTPAVK
jgi:phage FluMu protein Com